MSKPRILLFSLIGLLVVAAVVLVLALVLRDETGGAGESGTLTIWRVFDSDDSLDDIIASYREQHPNVTFNVVKVPEENLRERFLEALARDEQPDILTVHATRIQEFKEFLEPMPSSTQVPTVVTENTLGLSEQTTVQNVTYPSPSVRSIGEQFVTTVKESAVIDNEVYGLPLSVDSLALYYNQTLLDRAGIALPPSTYSELLADVPALTTRDEQGNIVQSAIAMGTTNNIDRYFDIVSLLMLQNGATMIDGSTAAFDKLTEDARNPGNQAVEFYVGFADPTKEAYTWNENQETARDKFAQGQLAFYLGYAYELPLINAAAAPGLEVGISTAPQTSATPLNYANYWIESVVSKSEMKQTAWNFILFAANSSNVPSYLEKTSKPPALRTLVEQYQNDVDIGVFAEQSLTAKSWYTGTDIEEAESAFEDMISSVLLKTATVEEAVTLTAQKITQTLTSQE